VIDDIIERALAHGDAGDVYATRTVAGRPCLSDGQGWISADSLVDLSEVR